MSYKGEERKHQIDWKDHTTTLSAEALRPGMYTGPSDGSASSRDEMFLHEARCEENLLPFVRKEALDIFERAGIDWHHGPTTHLPSNYLMDSMVSCVNCLLPFAHDGVSLATLLRPLVPEAVEAIPVEDGRVITFEWIGDDNPLRETSPKRKRGSHGTSVDAFCVVKRADGGHTGLLIEWKYTEGDRDEGPKHGNHYVDFLESGDGPVDVARCGGAAALFVDPLYQLARLQLLAHATEREHILGCDRVLVLVLVPAGNRAYRDRVPCTNLQRQFPGLGLAEVWPRVLRRPDRFALTSFDGLMTTFQDDAFPALAPVLREVRARYTRVGRHGA